MLPEFDRRNEEMSGMTVDRAGEEWCLNITAVTYVLTCSVASGNLFPRLNTRFDGEAATGISSSRSA